MNQVTIVISYLAEFGTHRDTNDRIFATKSDACFFELDSMGAWPSSFEKEPLMSLDVDDGDRRITSVSVDGGNSQILGKRSLWHQNRSCLEGEWIFVPPCLIALDCVAFRGAECCVLLCPGQAACKSKNKRKKLEKAMPPHGTDTQAEARLFTA